MKPGSHPLSKPVCAFPAQMDSPFLTFNRPSFGPLDVAVLMSDFRNGLNSHWLAQLGYPIRILTISGLFSRCHKLLRVSTDQARRCFSLSSVIIHNILDELSRLENAASEAAKCVCAARSLWVAH